jgi:hypothetical protein
MEENNTALLSIKELIGELEFQPENPLDSGEAFRILTQAKQALQELAVSGDTKAKGQVKKTIKELDKAENLVRMSTTLVGGRIAFSALSEFLKKTEGTIS